jgi:hypothetical protein
MGASQALEKQEDDEARRPYRAARLANLYGFIVIMVCGVRGRVLTTWAVKSIL